METQVFSDGGPPTSDSHVARIEKETESALQLAGQKSQTGDPRFPPRPGFGTQGRTVTLWANHLHMAFQGDLHLFRYNVEILPDQSGRRPAGKKARRIVQQLLEEHLPQYGRNVATDFKSNLISRKEIDLIEEGYDILYRNEYEEEPGPNAKTYKIRLQFTGALTVSELMNYLTSTGFGALFGSKEEIIQALNIVLGHHPKAAFHIASVGANKHYQIPTDNSDKFDLGAGLLALRGFFVSVRAATARVMVNVQVKNAAFYNDGPLEMVMRAFMGENGGSKVKLANFLKRVTIDITHLTSKNKQGQRVPRVKMIESLATPNDGQGSSSPPVVSNFGAGPRDVKFYLNGGDDDKRQSPKGKKGGKPSGPSPQGELISVYDYFKREYNITITDTALPVVNVGNRQNPRYLPAQVCHVLPGQPSRSKLSSGQTQKMIRFAVRKPVENANSIVSSGVQLLGFDPTNSTLETFGISVNPKLTAVPARVLNSPSVRYGGNQVASTRFGSWNMQNIQFSTKSNLPYWTYLWISSQDGRDQWRDPSELKYTIDAFTAMLRASGVNAQDCVPGLRITVNPGNVEAEVDNAIRRFAGNNNPPQMILVILPFADTTIYNRVKYACDVKEGLLNVCVTAQKFGKPNNSQYFANVALKFNLKLGGRNQFLDNNKLGLLAEGKTMVVGIDVTHPSPGSSSKAPSVAAIVSSIDQWLAQWPADLQLQQARQEMVSGLEPLFASRLQLWMKHNKEYPQNILVYRDGVSEGQYEQVLDQELPALRRACEKTYPATATKQGIPRITIVVVGKRHNTRFYPTRKDDADRSSNPQNGTVVDRGVTEARNWDFFLQAHAAIQGTARPAHYYVVYDEIFRSRKVQAPFQNSQEVLEDLTHNLCYLYGRATKAVSICPPAYYADLVCERARCYLSKLYDPTPVASPAMSEVSGGHQISEADSSQVKIHAKVRDSMFYI
jgi:eukaryotic translation initiation factor 2C